MYSKAIDSYLARRLFVRNGTIWDSKSCTQWWGTSEAMNCSPKKLKQVWGQRDQHTLWVHCHTNVTHAMFWLCSIISSSIINWKVLKRLQNHYMIEISPIKFLWLDWMINSKINHPDYHYGPSLQRLLWCCTKQEFKVEKKGLHRFHI